MPTPLLAEQIDDPQGCLSGDVANRVGQHAVFVHVVEEKCGYWLPIPLEIVPVTATNAPVVVSERYDPVDLSKLFKSNVTELLARSYVAPRSAFCSLAVPEHLLGGWSRDDVRFEIDDAGLRGAGGMLKTVFGIPFVTPADRAVANCRFLSFWEQDTQGVTVSLTGKAHTVYLLMTGTTFPLATGTEHGAVTVGYADGTISRLSLRAPETWWPVEQDYVTDGVLFSLDAARPLPPRVDLRSGRRGCWSMRDTRVGQFRAGRRRCCICRCMRIASWLRCGWSAGCMGLLWRCWGLLWGVDALAGLPACGGRVPLLEGTRRDAGGDAAGRDVSCDDGVRTDDGAVADRGSGEHGDAIADPDVLPDEDGSAAGEWACGGASVR